MIKRDFKISTPVFGFLGKPNIVRYKENFFCYCIKLNKNLLQYVLKRSIFSIFLFVQHLHNILYISEFNKNFVIIYIQIYNKINDKWNKDKIASNNIIIISYIYSKFLNFNLLFQVTNKGSVKVFYFLFKLFYIKFF